MNAPGTRETQQKTLLHVDVNIILQGVLIALVVWFGSRIVEVGELVRVHDWRLAAIELRTGELERSNRLIGDGRKKENGDH